MGYTITIGELAVEKNPGDGLACSCISFDAAGVKHEGAQLSATQRILPIHAGLVTPYGRIS